MRRLLALIVMSAAVSGCDLGKKVEDLTQRMGVVETQTRVLDKRVTAIEKQLSASTPPTTMATTPPCSVEVKDVAAAKLACPGPNVSWDITAWSWSGTNFKPETAFALPLGQPVHRMIGCKTGTMGEQAVLIFRVNGGVTVESNCIQFPPAVRISAVHP